jgi:hypothetical protein
MHEAAGGDRAVLPIPDRPYDGVVYEDAKDPNATFPPIEPLRPPTGAPNVLIVLQCDTASPVSDDYSSDSSCFTGTVEWMQLDIADAAEDVDHLISPEERVRIAMMRP